MSKYIEFSLEEIKNQLEGKYFLIYINYDKKNGIEIANNFSELKNSVENFYKLYAFNDNKMFSCVNFGHEKKMVLIEKKDILDIESKKIYLANNEITKIGGKNYNKIIVNIGIIDGKEIFQYAGLE